MSEFQFSPLQAGWLALEGKSTPMHLGALLYFKPPRGREDDFAAELVKDWLGCDQAVVPWNQRLAPGLPRGLRPRWQADPGFDPDYHFRHSALPAPGGERELGGLVSRLHSHPLDLSRPPWEVHLIEGLDGGRFALYLKLHAALFDGDGLLQALRSLLSDSARRRGMGPWWTQPQAGHRAVDSGAMPWLAMLRAARDRWRSGLSAATPWGGPRRAPRSALNDAIGPARRFATQTYSDQRLAAVAKRHAVRSDTIFYALVGSALRRFFREYNALPERSLVALVADRSRPDGLLAPLFLSLATRHADPRRRVAVLSRSLNLAERMLRLLPGADAQAQGSMTALTYLARQLAGLDHRLAPMFNLGIARFHFSDQPLYFNGARLDAIFPMPMLLQGGALNLAVLRYAKQWHVGLTGARDNLPHLQRIAVYMGLALDELEKDA